MTSAVVLFELLQEIGDFDIGVAVVRVLHFAPLAEKGVGFVEEENRVAPVGRRRRRVEVLLRLADVLADDAGEVDAEHVERRADCQSRRRSWSCPCRSRRRTGPLVLRCPSVSDRSPRRRRRCGGGGSLRRSRGSAGAWRREARDRPTSGSSRGAGRTGRSCSLTGCGSRWQDL